VQHDPELLLFFLFRLRKQMSMVELNAQDAEKMAAHRATSKVAKQIRATIVGEQSLFEFRQAIISKSRILIATALGAAQKINDLGGQIRYLTGIGAALDQAHR